MKFEETSIQDIYVIQPDIFEDNRGYFFEFYNKKTFQQIGIAPDFVQDNQSMSHKGVLRGLHFQIAPYEQGKLVRVIQGSVNDVVVDLRKDSSTFKKYFSTILSAENSLMLWIPPGFAHGFYTLEDNTIFTYKCTNYYNKEAERGIIWNDPELSINWGDANPMVSEKDASLPTWLKCLS
jgi:dTDP-4-dehydrorhamnose 3,5-epimerase